MRVGGSPSYFAGDDFCKLSLMRADRRVGSDLSGDVLARADLRARFMGADRGVGSDLLGDALVRDDLRARLGVDGRDTAELEVDAEGCPLSTELWESLTMGFRAGDPGTSGGEEFLAFGEGTGLTLRVLLDGVRMLSSSSFVSSRARLRLAEPVGSGLSSDLTLSVLSCRRRGSGMIGRSALDRERDASKGSSFALDGQSLRFSIPEND